MGVGAASTGMSGKSFLQEKIRERKGEVNNARARRKSVDFYDDRVVQSSPIRERRERDDGSGRPGSSAGAANGINGAQKIAVGMGVKQIEEVSSFVSSILIWIFRTGCMVGN
jgi:hypothetical protein